ncbi:MAG: hypothetical protein ACOYOU_05435, partial [Kiritimatiellia bacterium]
QPGPFPARYPRAWPRRVGGVENACCTALAALGSVRGGCDGAAFGAFPASYRERAPACRSSMSTVRA